jgi:CheY-like chemotaxis protein
MDMSLVAVMSSWRLAEHRPASTSRPPQAAAARTSAREAAAGRCMRASSHQIAARSNGTVQRACQMHGLPHGLSLACGGASQLRSDPPSPQASHVNLGGAMIFCFPRPKSISDLERNRGVMSKLRPPAELRREIKIAVVDDQPFAPEHNLKNNQFQIETFRDVQSVAQLAEFPIVLCDLQGVGVQLAADLQGAYLIEEIKSNYPEKAVIAFTGGSASSNISRRAAKAADGYLKKDASIDEWRDLLDKHIRNLSNPIYIWQRLRLRLVSEGIAPIDLLRLEDAYVSTVNKGAGATRASIEAVSRTSSLDPAVRKEITGFLASKAFDLVFQALVSSNT